MLAVGLHDDPVTQFEDKYPVKEGHLLFIQEIINYLKQKEKKTGFNLGMKKRK